jgi:hypothetical protein
MIPFVLLIKKTPTQCHQLPTTKDAKCRNTKSKFSEMHLSVDIQSAISRKTRMVDREL